MADILIVEDNEELGMLLSDFLTAEGYDVYHALSGFIGNSDFLNRRKKRMFIENTLDKEKKGALV